MRDKFTLHSAHSKNLLLPGYLKVINFEKIDIFCSLLVAVDLIQSFLLSFSVKSLMEVIKEPMQCGNSVIII